MQNPSKSIFLSVSMLFLLSWFGYSKSSAYPINKEPVMKNGKIVKRNGHLVYKDSPTSSLNQLIAQEITEKTSRPQIPAILQRSTHPYWPLYQGPNIQNTFEFPTYKFLTLKYRTPNQTYLLLTKK